MVSSSGTESIQNMNLCKQRASRGEFFHQDSVWCEAAPNDPEIDTDLFVCSRWPLHSSCGAAAELRKQ